MLFPMAGRPKKEYPGIYCPIEVELENGTHEFLDTIPILCPICMSSLVGYYGSHGRVKTRVQYYQCKNLNCSHLLRHKKGK
jgi:hypothetical protein